MPSTLRWSLRRRRKKEALVGREIGFSRSFFPPGVRSPQRSWRREKQSSKPYSSLAKSVAISPTQRLTTTCQKMWLRLSRLNQSYRPLTTWALRSTSRPLTLRPYCSPATHRQRMTMMLKSRQRPRCRPLIPSSVAQLIRFACTCAKWVPSSF